jgi:hypothetical protein
MVRKTLLVLTALLALAANRPDPNLAKGGKVTADDPLGDITGYYTCKGQETGGKTYAGIAVISKKNDVYTIQWTVGTGSNFVGVAVRQGNMLSASWALPAERGLIRGVNVYKIESGPRLTGRWATLPGSGYLQTETLTFLKNLDEED